MSFSLKVKKEITDREINAPCCANAASYGIACFGKYFDSKGVVLHTEQLFIAEWAKLIFELAGIEGKIYGKSGENSRIYEFSVKDEFEIEKLMAAVGHSGDETAISIRRENIVCDGCFQVFVAAAFMCCGTIVNPQKAYNLEFVNPRFKLMNDFENLLNERKFKPGRTLRKGANVIYFRSSEQIEDILTTMGAVKASMQLMNLKIFRDLRNNANRITNCETANIDKTIAANMQVIEAISLLRDKNMFDTLPDVIKNAAILREDNPDLSLSELVEISDEKVSKSGLSHRFRKICDMANNLKE